MECKLQNIKYIEELRCLKLARSGSCISTTRALSIVQDYGDQACNKLICWLEPLKNFSSVRSNTVFIGSCQCTQNKYFLLLWFSIFKMDKYYISVGHLEVSFYLSELLWQHHIIIEVCILQWAPCAFHMLQNASCSPKNELTSELNLFISDVWGQNSYSVLWFKM